MKRILFVLACVAMSGCVTVSYRRGASGEAMSADEKACREATENHAAYLKCLEARGTWTLDTSGAGSTAASAETPSESAATDAAPTQATESAATDAAPTQATESPEEDDDPSGFGTLPPDERDGAAQPLIGSF